MIERIRADRALDNIPVIVISGIKLNSYQECGTATGLPELIAEEIPDDLLLHIIKEQLHSESFGSPPGTQIKPRVLIADPQTELLMAITPLSGSR